jgi:hypothetical protein
MAKSKSKGKKLDKIIAELAKMKSEIKTLLKLHSSLGESLAKISVPAARTPPIKKPVAKKQTKAVAPRKPPVLVQVPDTTPAESRPPQDDGRALRAASSPRPR